MGVLKTVGYLVAAVAVLTALFTGVLVVVVIGIAGGILLDLCGATFFTAASMRAYFEGAKKRSDLE